MTQFGRAPSPSAAMIVEEVLGAVLSPRRVREVLKDACRLGGLDEVPRSATSLRVFVEGALFSTLSRELGISNALDVSEQIRAALALALASDETPGSSDIRVKGSAPPSEAPRVLVVTQASLVVFLLQDVLGDGIDVLPLSSESMLVDRLARQAGQRSLIIVDRRHPCVGPGVCSRLLELAPPTSTVIWWAGTRDERHVVEERMRGGPHLIATAPDMDLADLGELARGVIELMS